MTQQDAKEQRERDEEIANLASAIDCVALSVGPEKMALLVAGLKCAADALAVTFAPGDMAEAAFIRYGIATWEQRVSDAAMEEQP